MSIEDNKRAALRWSQELWSQGHLTVADKSSLPTTCATILAIRFRRTAPKT